MINHDVKPIHRGRVRIHNPNSLYYDDMDLILRELFDILVWEQIQVIYPITMMKRGTCIYRILDKAVWFYSSRVLINHQYWQSLLPSAFQLFAIAIHVALCKFIIWGEVVIIFCLFYPLLNKKPLMIFNSNKLIPFSFVWYETYRCCLLCSKSCRIHEQ